MSWWVTLEGAGEVEGFEEGGTYVLGGAIDASLNITYNYAPLYSQAWAGVGLRETLHGQRGGDTIQALEHAVRALGVEQGQDYWAATPGNAGHALSVLLGWARQYPDGIWRVN